MAPRRSRLTERVRRLNLRDGTGRSSERHDESMPPRTTGAGVMSGGMLNQRPSLARAHQQHDTQTTRTNTQGY